MQNFFRFQYNYISQYLILLFAFFLPFNYALTFKIGYNIKISEICIVLYILLNLKTIAAHLKDYKNSNIFLLLFIGWTLISLIVNSYYNYHYAFTEYPSRFGIMYDSIAKFSYLILAFLSFSILRFPENEGIKDRVINAFFYGTVTACIYTWYLVIISIQDIEPFLLPGMDAFPQHSLLSFGHYIRCGTFKEGNYMGLLLIIVTLWAYLRNKKWVAAIAFLTLFPVTSVTAFISLAVFLSVLIIYYSSKNKYIAVTFLAVIIVSLGILYAYRNNHDLQLLVFQKIMPIEKNVDYSKDWGAFSKAQRLNYIEVAKNIFLDNPVFGVGISNFSLHFAHYNKFPETTYQNIKPYKPIVNNIYMEILVEQGFVGLTLFALFLGSLFIKIKNNMYEIAIFAAVLVYMLAYPTYTMLFLWLYFAYFSRNNFTGSTESNLL